MNEIAVDDYAAYVGRTESVSGRVDAEPLEAMAAILDRSFSVMAPDGAVPPLWHWLLLRRHVQSSGIGPDGHPKRGGFMPPIDLPRRMFAGSRTQFLGTLKVGDAIRRDSTILSVSPKSGRTGKLVFVTVRHAISGPEGIAINEEQDIVYREPAPETGAPASAPAAPASPDALPAFDADETVSPDPVMLFRFSAASGNSHRIHYDADYAKSEENYPGLVVHGPLQAILLADLCRRQWGARTLATFDFKAVRPVFLGAPMRLVLAGTEAGADLQTLDADGRTCVSARAT